MVVVLHQDDECQLKATASSKGRRGGDIQSYLIPNDGNQDHVDGPGEDIGYQRHGEQELAEFGGAPRPLQVFSAVENCCASDEKSQSILLDQCSAEEDPWVYDSQLWFYCKVRNAVDPLPVSDCIVKDGESNKNDK